MGFQGPPLSCPQVPPGTALGHPLVPRKFWAPRGPPWVPRGPPRDLLFATRWCPQYSSKKSGHLVDPQGSPKRYRPIVRRVVVRRSDPNHMALLLFEELCVLASRVLFRLKDPANVDSSDRLYSGSAHSLSTLPCVRARPMQVSLACPRTPLQ